MEVHPALDDNRRKDRKRGRTLRNVALLLSIVILTVGILGAPIVTRIYFVHGGTRVWVTTLAQFIAFPIVLPFIYGSYAHRNRNGDTRVFHLSVKVMAASVAVGLIGVLNAWFYAYGIMSIPASTSTLIISTQIVFTALFAFLFVRQKFTAFSVNAIVLLLIGIVLLGVQSGSERISGQSTKKYLLGFFAMLTAAALFGLSLPLIQWIYLRFKQKQSISTVLEMQLIYSVVGSVFSAVAMAINHDYRAVSREAEMYALGKTKYYTVLMSQAVLWQMTTVGYLGVISCSSALLAGVVISMLLPVGEIMPVLLLGEKFTSAKGIATALCLWGFLSYLYGDYDHMNRMPAAPMNDGSEELLAAQLEEPRQPEISMVGLDHDSV